MKGGRLEIQYDQLPSQKRFRDSKARFKGFSGPIGSGKSAALCHEALYMAMVNNGCTGLIGAPTYPMLKDATLPEMFRILELNKFDYEHHKSDSVLVLPYWDAKILLRSVDDYEKLRGTNLAWFGVDELTYTNEEAWKRLEGRLRDPQAVDLRGFGVWTPKGHDWVYRRFVESPPEGYECIQAEPFENRFLLEKIPGYYEGLRQSYDKTFYEQEVLGIYHGMQDSLVYKRFDKYRNVEPQHLNPALPLMWALDFNVDPMSSVVVQVDGDRVLVLDEIVLRRVGTREACEEFLERHPTFPAGLQVFADASAHADKTSGWSDREMLEEFFAERNCGNVRFRIPKANPAVRRRVELMNGKLHSAAGERLLRVDPKCKELILDFQSVTWVEGTHEIDKAKDARRTHLSDALGYLVWQEFRDKEPTNGHRQTPLPMQ